MPPCRPPADLSAAAFAALDRALDRRLGAIRGAADQPELERTDRMRAEVDAVIAALRGDGVDPAGFG